MPIADVITLAAIGAAFVLFMVVLAVGLITSGG